MKQGLFHFIQFCGYLMDPQLNHILFHLKQLFCDYFNHHPDVHQCLKNLLFFCLRDFLKWKYS